MSPAKVFLNARDRIISKARPGESSLRWALARMGVQAYVIFSFFTVIGGALTYPLACKILLDDWRFWRYLGLAPRLYVFLWRSALIIAAGFFRKGGTPYGFMFSVPLSAPPATAPDPAATVLRADWPHGEECGPCSNCCIKLGCPVHDDKTGLCRGYDSIYWRYFNCGRFPISEHQLEFYSCQKWELRDPEA